MDDLLPDPPARVDSDGRFPFGALNTPRPVRWDGTGSPRQLILGVYPSAFHVQWSPPAHLAGVGRIGALAVDVEPTVFWNGLTPDPAACLGDWMTRVGFRAGDEVQSHGQVGPCTNGPSGHTLDDYFRGLPFGIRETAFADVYPVYQAKRSKPSGTKRRQQGDVQDQKFNPAAAQLPRTLLGAAGPATLPTRPAKSDLPGLAAERFGNWLVTLLRTARFQTVVTLGEEPWDTLMLLDGIIASAPASGLRATRFAGYGTPGRVFVDGHEMQWIPLAHPGLLQGPSAVRGDPTWRQVHSAWVEACPPPKS